MHKRKEPETSSPAKNMVHSGARPPRAPPTGVVLALEAPNISASRSLRRRGRAGGRSSRGGRSGGDTISGSGGRSRGDSMPGRGGRSGGDTISGRGGRSGGNNMPGRGGRSGGDTISGRGGRSGGNSMPGRGGRSGGESISSRGGQSTRGRARGRGCRLRLPTKQKRKLLLEEKARETISIDLATMSMTRECSSTSGNILVALTPENNITDQGLPRSNPMVMIRQSEADEIEAFANASAPEPEASAQADPSTEPTGSGKADKAKLSLKSLEPVD